MKKQFFFLTGLPRTGNTLLSSILNQNKNIKVSPYSIMPEILNKIDDIKNSINYKLFPLEKNVNNVLKNAFNNYYKDWNCNYIIDRGPWATRPNLNILKIIFDKEIKMIILRRPLFEVLASYVNIVKPNNVEKYIDDLISDQSSMIMMNIYPYINLVKEKNIKYHIIEYEDLLNNTKKTIKNLYNFLNIPIFSHYYENLNQFSIDNIKYNDKILGNNINFHTIRTDKIEHIKCDYKNILPNSVLKKYKKLSEEIYKIK